MKLLLLGHEDRYAIEQLQLALFPEETMEPVDEKFEGDGAVSSLSLGKFWATATAKITLHGKTGKAARRIHLDMLDVVSRRKLLANVYYEAAIQIRSAPEWGSLSGVRPSKITTKWLLEGDTPLQADQKMEKLYHVSEARRKLCVESSVATVKAVDKLRDNDISLYIGIPFCPTRCAYCSFVSASVGKMTALLEPFLECLIREVEETGRLVKQYGKTVRTVYMGGGTPTTLSTEQMERLLKAINANFNLSQCLEFTVEGGRPDTLSVEKLTAIRENGCDRMSINPQTMNDEVLACIGRRHSSRQTVDAFSQARQAGFDGINMDLIVGLPNDTEESFHQSLTDVIALEPSNITVHTLSLKKGADLFFQRMHLLTADEVSNMLKDAERILREAGYVPYYLYKQKYMSGSFENVGWCKPGKECLYNIYMMEEIHSIISLGGGGMTKINLSNGKLERFHNPKYPQQYIEKFEDVLKQKQEAFELLVQQDQ